MNNKGQTLVLFVILLPLIFILISFCLDNGNLLLEKTKINNTIKDLVKGEFKNNLDLEELKNLINKNIDVNIDKINMENEILYLTISKKYDGIIFKKNYTIKLSYKAYMENDKVIIKKE